MRLSDDAVARLEQLMERRARLADEADALARELELWPSPALHKRLEHVVREIDRLDRQLEASRRESPAA
jgi:hypothetical protein